MNRIALLACLCMSMSLTAGPTTAQELPRTWVSGLGSDANACNRQAPCLTFTHALTRTRSGGEINCADHAGTGVVTITKSVTIDCAGSSWGISADGNAGITINDAGSGSPNTIVVIIRNMSITSNPVSPATHGIRILSARLVIVENVALDNFTAGAGIEVAKQGIGFLTVRNVSFNRAAVGVRLQTTAQTFTASIDNSRFNNLGFHGVQVGLNSTVNITNSIFSSLGGSAIFATTSTSVVYAENNVIHNSSIGINAYGPGSKISASGNSVYGSGSKAFSVTSGAILLSGGGNKLDINPGNPPTGALTSR